MKTKILGLLAAVVFLFGSSGARAVDLDISTIVGAALRFTGGAGDNDTFTFMNDAGGHSFTIAASDGAPPTSVNSPGAISGTFTIGPEGPAGHAAVSGTGTLTINDGAATFTATIDWVSIDFVGTSGFLNVQGTVNLTARTYNGTKADLLTLATAPTVIATLQFGFVPARTLADLKTTGAVNDTTFSGDLFGIVPPVTANCVAINNAVAGVPITPVQMVGSGGCGGPYTFSAVGLPPNVTMSSSGLISGTPLNSGNFNYTVTVTDNCGNSGTVNCSVTVNPPPTANCVAINNAVVGVPITPVTMVGSGGCGGPYTFSAVGLPAGVTMSSGGTISGTPTVSGSFSYTVTVTDNCGNVGTKDCSVTVGGTGCPVCVDPDIGLGAAAGCTVLQLGAAKVDITGPAGGIIGDVCIAPNGKLSMSGDEYVTGLIKLGAGATFANSSHGTVNVVQPVDLSAEIAAAYAANLNAANTPCTQVFAKLDGKTVTTITGVVGLNVICVGDITLSGKQITLTGPVGAKFVLNIMGKLTLTGGGAGPQIRVGGGVQSKDVLYNLIGVGSDVAFSGGGGGVNCCAAIVDGTILAPYRKINLAPGLVNGQIISGRDISIVSGSSVRCPPCP